MKRRRPEKYGARRYLRRLRFETCEDRLLLTALVLTDQEQLLLELINRARSDPAAEATRQGIGLNDGLAPGTISPDPKQPLAPHPSLLTAAGLHSQEMLDHDYFSHTGRDGSSPTDRAQAEGYPTGVAENISWNGVWGAPLDRNQAVVDGHNGLLRSPGHRQNLLDAPDREIGVGVRYGPFTHTDGITYNACMMTENFGNTPGDAYLTGVAYTDADVADDFYTIGEGLPDVTIIARETTTAEVHTTVSGPSGGYAIRLPAGVYTVTATSTASTSGFAFTSVAVGGNNRKLDFNWSDAEPLFDTFVVNSTGDQQDALPGDGSCDTGATTGGSACTLRAAIEEALARSGVKPGTPEINFALPGAGPHAIRPSSPLPTIAAPLRIDASTQPGYDGLPLVELVGADAGAGTAGLRITGGASLIQGLAVNRFAGHGIEITGGGQNQILGCLLGTDPTGTLALGNGNHGISVTSAGNRIGGPGSGEGNLISGNLRGGLRLAGAAATENIVQGNRVGTDVTGTHELGNREAGVAVSGSNNLVGGSLPGERNLLSGNGLQGVALYGPGNRVQGNWIGTDAGGTLKIPNRDYGMAIYAADNMIGGAPAGEGNVISGNRFGGVLIRGAATSGNRLQGNRIGTDPTGATPVGNTLTGVAVDASGNTIGGAAAEGNLLSGNGREGISLYKPGNEVFGNLIGTDATGSSPLANGGWGVYIVTYDSRIGGSATGESGNVISSNAMGGVFLNGGGAHDNVIRSNRIGTNRSGTQSLGNQGVGVYLNRSFRNTIGGAGPAGNTIGANTREGLWISGEPAAGNAILGNFIGTNSSGDSGLGNGSHGVYITATGNFIGGRSHGEGNVISGNARNGIVLSGSSARANAVWGNRIGTDPSGTRAVANGASGIAISGSANTIGDAATGNVIAGNAVDGVQLHGTGNLLRGNWIGTDTGGALALGNRAYGVAVFASFNIVGGNAALGEGNTIAWNRGSGLFVSGTATSGVTIAGNSMHDNAGPGIDLAPSGRTLNDAGDADSGANQLQNFPEILSAVVSGGSLTVRYEVPSAAAHSAYPLTVEFFAADAGGEEGQRSLGSHTYAAPGIATAVLPAGGMVAGDLLVATATDAGDNTSEFSDAAVATAPLPAALAAHNGAGDAEDSDLADFDWLDFSQSKGELTEIDRIFAEGTWA